MMAVTGSDISSALRAKCLTTYYPRPALAEPGNHSARISDVTLRLLRALHRRKLVTWERTDPNACVLMVTNAWPHPERPTYGTFVQHAVDGLLAQELRSDVLFVRGYRGWH